MIETGIVSKINSDGTALVITTKSNSVCESCQLCSNLGNNQYGVIADNPPQADINDMVVVFIPENKNAISIFLFLIPIFMFFAGYIAAQILFRKLGLSFNELIGAGSGVGITVLYFFIFNRIYKKTIKKKDMAKITKILPIIELSAQKTNKPNEE